MKTKEKGTRIFELKELIKKNATLLHNKKKKREKDNHLSYETRHLYIAYGALRGIGRDRIEKHSRWARPLDENLISQLMTKYL